MADEQTINGEQFHARGVEGWVFLLGGIQTRVASGDFVTGLAIVNEIGAAAEEMNHHPDLDLRYPYVDVRLSSHDVGGVSERDVELAGRIAEIARSHGADLDPTGVSAVEWGLDAADGGRLAPFWAAVLGTEAQHVEELDEFQVVDGDGVLPTVWFQQSDSTEAGRQRWHPDVWVQPDQVQSRIDAALVAGGRLVSDASAPRFWVLADPDDNLVCFCTWQGRE